MRKGDVAQPLRRDHRIDRLTNKRKQLPQPGVKKQRLVINDQVLVERQAPGTTVTGVLMR